MGNIAPASYFVAASTPAHIRETTHSFRLSASRSTPRASGAPTLSAAADPQSGTTIQVQINNLPVREPKLDARISSEFVLRIQEVFRQRGYAGAVVGVVEYDRPDPGCYLLTLDLSDWNWIARAMRAAPSKPV